MRVFMTGASGWIGGATVPHLIEAGHTVVGIARSDAAAEKLRAVSVEPIAGSLDDLDLIRSTAAASDGVIHLAFKHDIAFTGDFQGAMDADYEAVEAIGDALAGSDRPFVIASGIIGIAPGRVATEQDGHGALEETELFGMSLNAGHNRLETAEYTLGLAEKGVRSSIVRLAPTNHGDGDNGFLAGLVAIAKRTGVAAYIGDGATRWSAVHRLDSGALFALALEQAPAGSTLHGTAEEGVAQREIAEAIGRGLDVPVRSVTADEAGAHFGFLAGPLMADCPASSVATQQLLGWAPAQPGLIADLDTGHYFG